MISWFDENKTKTETEPESTPSIEVLPSKEFLKFRPEIKTDKEFKEWNGHALVTSLKNKSLIKLAFNDISNVKEESLEKSQELSCDKDK